MTPPGRPFTLDEALALPRRSWPRCRAYASTTARMVRRTKEQAE